MILAAFSLLFASLIAASGQKASKPSAVVHLDQDWLTYGVNGLNKKRRASRSKSPRVSPRHLVADDGLTIQLSMAYYGHDDAIPEPISKK